MKRSLTICCLVLFTGIEEVSSQLGPEVPILGKGTLGYNGVAVLDVASPTKYSYNPAVVPFALRLFDKQGYAEIDYGRIDFREGPRVKNLWQYVVFQLDQDVGMRLARYTISSNQKPIAFLNPALSVRFDGETYEIACGRILSEKMGLGIAVIPYEKVRTTVSDNGLTAVLAEAKSDLHWRLGSVYLIKPNLSLGIVYTRDKIEAVSIFSPALTGLAEDSRLRAGYTEKLLTVGVTWQPRQGTVLYLTHQNGDITGQNLNEKVSLTAYGIQQFLNQNLAVRIGLNDSAPSYELVYCRRAWEVGVSYSNNTFRRTEGFLGRADICYLWLGKSF
jgi:hypothetical protein